VHTGAQWLSLGLAVGGKWVREIFWGTIGWKIIKIINKKLLCIREKNGLGAGASHSTPMELQFLVATVVFKVITKYFTGHLSLVEMPIRATT
jgi:hypothetical protein